MFLLWRSVAYIFYTLWQYLEFIEEQLGPVRNVVTLDCLPRPGYRLQTSHNTKLPDGETNKMYIPHWLKAVGLHIHLSSLMVAKMSILSSGWILHCSLLISCLPHCVSSLLWLQFPHCSATVIYTAVHPELWRDNEKWCQNVLQLSHYLIAASLSSAWVRSVKDCQH